MDGRGCFIQNRFICLFICIICLYIFICVFSVLVYVYRLVHNIHNCCVGSSDSSVTLYSLYSIYCLILSCTCFACSPFPVCFIVVHQCCVHVLMLCRRRCLGTLNHSTGSGIFWMNGTLLLTGTWSSMMNRFISLPADSQVRAGTSLELWNPGLESKWEFFEELEYLVTRLSKWLVFFVANSVSAHLCCVTRPPRS